MMSRRFIRATHIANVAGDTFKVGPPTTITIALVLVIKRIVKFTETNTALICFAHSEN